MSVETSYLQMFGPQLNKYQEFSLTKARHNFKWVDIKLIKLAL